MNTFLVAVAVVAALAAFVVLRRQGGLTSTVHAWEHGLLYVDGSFERVLPAGRYRTFGLADRLVVTLPRRPLPETVHAVEVTSQDRLSFRMSATVLYEIADPRLAQEGNHRELVRLAVSEAVVQLAATRTIEAMLAERSSLGTVLLGMLASPIGGCTITEAFVTSVTLPPELRRLHAEVERARLEGLAALERARGEHAALRSLSNAARMLKGNPELMNLRLLQAVSTAGTKTTLVLGRDGLSVPEGGDAGEA